MLPVVVMLLLFVVKSIYPFGNRSFLSGCDALILPGGGDITPAFFGERNRASHNIDTELDVLQFQALDLFLRVTDGSMPAEAT